MVAHRTAQFYCGPWGQDPRRMCAAQYSEARKPEGVLAKRCIRRRRHDEHAPKESQAGRAFGVTTRRPIFLSVWGFLHLLLHFDLMTSRKKRRVQRKGRVLPHSGPGHVLWYVPSGSRPSFAEVFAQCLAMLAHGPKAEAIDFSDQRQHLAEQETT